MRRQPVLLAVLVAVAFLIRLGFFLGDPNPRESAGLVASHGEVARNIVVHGRWFVINRARPSDKRPDGRLADPSELDYRAADRHPRFEPFAFEMPGAALVLAAAWKLTGDFDYGYVQVLQAVLDSLMVLLVYWCALTLFRRRRVALMAAAGYAVFLPVAHLMRVAHLDSWAVFFTIGVFALFLRSIRAGRPVPWLLATGVATGVGVYFRPGLLLLPAVLGLAHALSGERRRALLAGAIPTAVAVLLLAPWTIRNYVEYHELIPTRISVGQNLWEGLGEIPNDFGAVLDDVSTERQVARERPDLLYGTPQYDNYLRKKAIDAIRAHPAHYAKVVARRMAMSTVLLRNFGWTGHPESLSEFRSRTGKGRVSYVVDVPGDALRSLLTQLLEPLLFLVAMATVVATWKRFRAEHLLLLAVPVATLLPYLVLHVESRYLLPASFVYIVLAAVGVDALLERRARPTATRRAPAMAAR